MDVDLAIEKIGVGRFQWPVLIATGLTWSGDAMELSVMAYVLPVLQHEWAVSQPAADSFASIIFVGMLVGAFGWGLLSDAYGRRVGWQASTALTAIAGVLSAAAPDGAVGTFLALRACVGVGLAGTNIGFALSSELLPRRDRGTLLMLFELFFVSGSVVEVLLAWLALSSYGWRSVLLLSTLPLWVALALSPYVPESPRWLASHGHTAAAAAVLRRGATANGRPPPLPADATLVCASDTDGSRAGDEGTDVGNGGGGGSGADAEALDAARAPSHCSSVDISQIRPTSRASGGSSACAAPCTTVWRAARGGALHLATTVFDRRVRFTSLAICIAWGSAWFAYFGCILLTPKVLAAALPPSPPSPPSMLSAPNASAPAMLTAGTHADEVYASSLLATLAEVPGLLLATCAVNRLGRVQTIATCMLLACTALIATALVHTAADIRGSVGLRATPLALLQVVLLAFARLCSFGGFSALYLLTAESYPTRLRATAFGLVSACSRLAGTATPFVAGTVWAASPLGALLAYATSAAICAIVLLVAVADTSRRAMPDELHALVPTPLGDGAGD